tara:strand:+ start:3854 stop:4453 length:600 start_codon:yes stop_codon:yes gene_type:complete
MTNIEKDNIIKQNLSEQIQCIKKISEENIEEIKNISNILEECREKQNTIYVVGNGGSGSTASHFVSDLLKTSILENTPRFRAISLTDNIPVLSAWANDTSYENIFVGQLENFLQSNDVVIAISGSGNSPNVINAIKYANKQDIQTISFTGKDGGDLARLTKINLTIPSFDMLTIETMHLLICHLLTTMLRKTGKPVFSY